MFPLVIGEARQGQMLLPDLMDPEATADLGFRGPLNLNPGP